MVGRITQDEITPPDDLVLKVAQHTKTPKAPGSPTEESLDALSLKQQKPLLDILEELVIELEDSLTECYSLMVATRLARTDLMLAKVVERVYRPPQSNDRP